MYEWYFDTESVKIREASFQRSLDRCVLETTFLTVLDCRTFFSVLFSILNYYLIIGSGTERGLPRFPALLPHGSPKPVVQPLFDLSCEKLFLYFP